MSLLIIHSHYYGHSEIYYVYEHLSYYEGYYLDIENEWLLYDIVLINKIMEQIEEIIQFNGYARILTCVDIPLICYPFIFNYLKRY